MNQASTIVRLIHIWEFHVINVVSSLHSRSGVHGVGQAI